MMRVTRFGSSPHDHLSWRDVQDIGDLLAQLSPDAPPATHIGLMGMMKRTSLFLCRDDDGRIAGIACLAPVHGLLGLKGQVEDVVVDERCRGKGVGRTLMEAIIAHAQALDMRCVELTSAPGRVAANTMYVSMGFSRRDTNAYRLTLDK